MAIVCLTASFLLLSPEVAQYLGDRLQTTSVGARLDAFSAALQVTSQNYLLAIGSGVSLSAVSDDSLRSVHNAYLQNVLWFGILGGSVLSAAMLLLPWLVRRMSISTREALIAKRALATSLLLLLVVNISQASWEGSVLRVWIYVIVGLGVLMINQLDKSRSGIASR